MFGFGMPELIITMIIFGGPALVVVAIILIMKSKNSNRIQYPVCSCGATIPQDAFFCPKCGTKRGA